MTFSRSFRVRPDQPVQEAAASCDINELSQEHRDLFDLGVESAVGMLKQLEGEELRGVTITGWVPASGMDRYGTVGLTVNIARIYEQGEIIPQTPADAELADAMREVESD